jgi:hypothetical protein
LSFFADRERRAEFNRHARKADAVAYESERAELTALADEWLDKIIEIKQKRMEPQPQ